LEELIEMRVLDLENLSIHYLRGDESTAREVQELWTPAVRAAREMFGLSPPPIVRVHVVQTWPQLVFRGVDLARKALSLYSLPMFWYILSFCRGWRDSYVNVDFLSKAVAAMRVKSLRRLPADLPPHLHPTWEGQPPLIMDRPALWRREISRMLVQASCARRLPPWLMVGISDYVVRRILPSPPPPTAYEPIIRWAGSPLYALMDLRKLKRFSQEQIDELAARIAWPLVTVEYLEAAHRGVLWQMIAAKVPLKTFELQLASNLGMPPAALWDLLATRMLEHFERSVPVEVLPMPGETQLAPIHAAQPEPASPNPFASPQPAAIVRRDQRSVLPKWGPRLGGTAGCLALLAAGSGAVLLGHWYGLGAMALGVVVLPFLLIWLLMVAGVGLAVLGEVLFRRDN
jgi:hypothetical protein